MGLHSPYTCILVLALCVSLSYGIPATYENCMSLNEQYDFEVHWTLTNTAAHVKFVAATPRGYAAIALYPQNGPEMHPKPSDGVYLDIWAAAVGNGGMCSCIDPRLSLSLSSLSEY
eukprot:TRINITY_DN42698_c0_g1_i1.p1 TRINITY_DN42698_c0_g1~~TRINITY_DN42698_c0_g1_i1.p1  ORF type:complete len:125 (+),score=7.82 TRINITY_DN42698_c0_g1_i1:28-375(+)